MAQLFNYQWASFVPRSQDYKVVVNGEDVHVHSTKISDYAIFSFEGEVEIELHLKKEVAKAAVKPLSKAISSTIDGNIVRFKLSKAGNFLVEVQGVKDLFIYANPPEQNVPSKDDDNVIFFEGGQVYDVGRLTVDNDNSVIYVEGGAILKGRFNSMGAKNITLRGRGIMDASHIPAGEERMVVFEACENVLLEGIVTVGTPSWNTVFAVCNNVHVDNYKTIGMVMTSDGIDIVGGSNVLIENCCLRSNDDCVVVKSFKGGFEYDPDARVHWSGNVENVEVRNCVIYNDQCGNGLEIGFETSCEYMRNIRFVDIDILYCHGSSGVFTIHNGDRAVIENVLYKNIRVEHLFGLFVDFRVMYSRYSRDEQRGIIRNIRFEDIQCCDNYFNAISLFGGEIQGDNVAVDGVTFKNCYFGKEKIDSIQKIEGYNLNAQNIIFE